MATKKPENKIEESKKSNSKDNNPGGQMQSNTGEVDSEQVAEEEKTPQISRAKMEMLVRNAALTGEIDPEVAMTIAKLIYTTAALADGQAIAKITLKFHDSDLDQGRLRMHGKYGFCLACIKIDTQFGHCCMTIAPGSSRCCLIPNSLVFLANGTSATVSDLKVGDVILGYDADADIEIDTTVTDVVGNHLREAYYTINDNLGITGDHPVLARRGNSSWKWNRVDRLAVGDEVRTAKGKILVNSISECKGVVNTIYVETASEGFFVGLGNSRIVVSGRYFSDMADELLQHMAHGPESRYIVN